MGTAGRRSSGRGIYHGAAPEFGGETMTVKFEAEGDPVGKARPRVTKAGHAYTPGKTAAKEHEVRTCYREAAGGFAFDGNKPLGVAITAYYRIPKSYTKGRRLAAEHNITRPGRPDIDNVLKLVLDALNGIAYGDDSQVCHIEAYKYYGDRARVEVEITDEVTAWGMNGGIGE